MAARSARLPVIDALVRGAEYQLPPLRLAVPRPPGSLGAYWLTFEFAARDARPDRGAFTTYTCARETLAGRPRRSGTGLLAYESAC